MPQDDDQVRWLREVGRFIAAEKAAASAKAPPAASDLDTPEDASEPGRIDGEAAMRRHIELQTNLSILGRGIAAARVADAMNGKPPAAHMSAAEAAERDPFGVRRIPSDALVRASEDIGWMRSMTDVYGRPMVDRVGEFFDALVARLGRPPA